MMDPNTSNAIIAIGTIWGVLVTIILFYVGAKAAKIDKLEAALKSKTEEVVNARFATLASEFKTAIVGLETNVKIMLGRLEKGDREFKEDDEARHKLELSIVTKMAEKCVSKAEFEKFEARFETRMLSLENSVTRFIASSRPSIPGVPINEPR